MKFRKKKLSHKRAVVSIALFILFILLPVSGKMIEIVTYNPYARFIWGGIHYLLGLLFIIFGIFHIIYNWNMLKNYLKRK